MLAGPLLDLSRKFIILLIPMCWSFPDLLLETTTGTCTVINEALILAVSISGDCQKYIFNDISRFNLI